MAHTATKFAGPCQVSARGLATRIPTPTNSANSVAESANRARIVYRRGILPAALMGHYGYYRQIGHVTKCLRAMHTAVEVEEETEESDTEVAEVSEEEADGKLPEASREKASEVNEQTVSRLENLLEDDDVAKPAEVVEVEAQQEDESLKLVNCGLCDETLRALEKRGITALFPIQKHVFDPVLEGRDLIGRAKTGSGKTLAFAIPVIEKLIKQNKDDPPRRGRTPRCIVMTPTRELANQVAREFQSAAPTLSLGCFYGGVPAGGQKRLLRDGCDVAVGTPGRIIDLIEQQALNLSRVQFAILDESDQMLDMGFEEDMEKILQHAPVDRQTLLFSATLPGWVKKVSRKYLKNHILVDLVGEEATGKISDTITAMGIIVDRRSKRNVLADLLSVHAAGTNCIVFCQTKRECDFVANAVTTTVPCEALHGDIPQQQRELSLGRFRQGKFNVLVATDVAARGLDIPNVDLVVHYDMPESNESFLHRSGRTGRAGKSGSTIVMVVRDEARDFKRMLRETRTKIEMIGPPAPRDVMQASARSVLQRMQTVEPEVIKFFQPAAEKVIKGGNTPQVLAAAFAVMSGFSKVPAHRSLLTQESGMVTLRVLGRHGRINTKSAIVAIVRDIAGEQALGKLGRVEMIEDEETHQAGSLFDLPVDHAINFLQNASQDPDGKGRGLQFDRPKFISLSQALGDDNHYGGGGARRRGGRGGRGRWGGGGGNRASDRFERGGYGGRGGGGWQGRDRGGDRRMGGGRERGGGGWGGRDRREGGWGGGGGGRRGDGGWGSRNGGGWGGGRSGGWSDDDRGGRW